MTKPTTASLANRTGREMMELETALGGGSLRSTIGTRSFRVQMGQNTGLRGAFLVIVESKFECASRLRW
jgi:hypothetical protein